MKQYRLVDIFFLLVTFLLKMREYFEEKFLVGHIWKWNGQEKSLDFVKRTLKIFTWRDKRNSESETPNVQCSSYLFNPLTRMSDQNRISPNNINTISTRWVMRIKKNINLVIISWSNTKFSELTLYE